MRHPGAAAALALAALSSAGLAGCGTAHPSSAGPRANPLPAGYVPIPAGRGPAYRLPALSPREASRRATAGMRCTRHHGPSYAVHLELYARRLVLPVPAGIGIAPPVRRAGAYVRAGTCSYPLRTHEPTGLVIVDARRSPPSLGTLFATWGQPLGPERLAGFRGRVLAFVGGRRFRGAPGAIRLTRHAEIVLEVDGYVFPHALYTYPPGL